MAAVIAELSEVEDIEEVRDEDWRSAKCALEVGIEERFLASLPARSGAVGGMTARCTFSRRTAQGSAF